MPDILIRNFEMPKDHSLWFVIRLDGMLLMDGRVVLCDEDCGDCLCRFCARNSYTDNYNINISYADCMPCEHCFIGETLLVESELDCPDFAPDEFI